jgi:7-cyano-7-deazaguanine tRNA-ribosyltransferase
MDRYRVHNHIEGIPVIQGYDVPSMAFCAHRLREIGFSCLGLGSLAPLKHHPEIMARVETVMDIVGPDLHIFGVSVIRTLHALRDLGIRSVDSARPAKAAMYNQVFYSKPFRRFAISKSRDKVGAAMPDHRRLTEPFPATVLPAAARPIPTF